MPNGSDENTIPFSTRVHQARELLRRALTAQLDNLITERLTPQGSGVPFVNFDTDPPQVITFKKLINCLYHAEEGFKHWEKIDSSTAWGKAKGAKQLAEALIQIYKSIGMLDDASPEMRRIVADNFYLLEPVFTQSYQIIKDSGWLSEFMKMDVTDKASKVIIQGMDLLGPEIHQKDHGHPLISAFTKISKLAKLTSSIQDKEMSTEDKEQVIALLHLILHDLENNPFISKLNITDLEHSKAINDLFSWFKSIEEDGFNFTKRSLQHYISWANTYLPGLIGFADQLEQQNYLKSGILSAGLYAQMTHLTEQANQMLSEASLKMSARVITIDSLNEYREKQFTVIQIKGVTAILTAEKQKTAATEFYQILKTYQGASFSDITESDRVRLRVLYPKIQMALAHTDLNLENQFTAALNKVGPERTASTAWWQRAAGYVASYVISPEVSSLLGTKNAVDQLIESKIASEHFKVVIAEKSREQLGDQIERRPFKERAERRINRLKSELSTPTIHEEPVPHEITPVKADNLVNLRGTLTLIQKMKLSTSVYETRARLHILIHRHIPAPYRTHFPNLPYLTDKNDPELVKQLKEIEQSLVQLENALRDLEGFDLSYGVMIRLRTFIAIGSAASQLNSSIQNLSPETQEVIAPIVQQMIAYSRSFSDMSVIDSDLSSLHQLKENRDPSALIVTEPQLTQEAEQNDELSEPKESVDILDYVSTITSARTSLLHRFQTTLASPIAAHLVPQEKGVPFIDIDSDPPQVAAIKKIINSMYHAECALKTWHGIDTKTQFGKIAAVHQGVAALSQVYKSLALITEASSEIQTLMRENDDLIKPMYQKAHALITQSGWVSQFGAFEVTKKVGSLLGQWTNSIKTDSSQTSSLTRLVSELPQLMNNISSMLDSNKGRAIEQLRISDKRISDINHLFEHVFERHSSFPNLFKGFSAIIGLIDLNKKIQREGTTLQDSLLQSYQEWLEESYPHLMVMLDEVETRYYLAPGFLSKAISLEIDQLNDRINETIEAQKDPKLKPIPLSFDMGLRRKRELLSNKKELLLDLFQIEKQQQSAEDFFELLKKANASELSSDELGTLRRTFTDIQRAMASHNLELTNEFVALLNQLETTTAGRAEFKVLLPSLMKLEPLVIHYLNEYKQSYELKIDVIDEAVEYVKAHSFNLQTDSSDEINVLQLRKKFHEEESSKPIVAPGDLKLIPASSITSVRGNITYIQELKLSSSVAKIREDFRVITQEHFSTQLQNCLKKEARQPLHVIQDTDHPMVRQIKAVENSFYYLENTLHHFEQMEKNDSLVSQAKALLEIASNARQLKIAMEHLTPELVHRYGPLVTNVLDFGKKIQSIKYNKEDWADLGFILDRAHQEFLKRSTPRKDYIQKAFREAGVPEELVTIDLTEPAGKKAVKLGIKYVHLISPQLENARIYLRSKYDKAYGEQPPILRSFAREELADSELMRRVAERLKESVDEHYGINFATANVLIKLLRQIQRAGTQTVEVADMVSLLVRDDFPKIKADCYKELIIALSKEEDYLCLKPGTLINPAMAAINQLFLSAALELDMPFNKKLAIMDEERYIKIVLKETQKEIKILNDALLKDPTNEEIRLNITIKKDKAAFLKEQIKLLHDNNPDTTKSALLDLQFEIILRDHLINTAIRAPIIQEYEEIVREHYNKNKAQYLLAEECTTEIKKSLKQFQKDNLADYLVVYETYNKLHRFSLKLPDKNRDLKNYIGEINKILVNEDLSIQQRALKAKSLPNDKEFNQKLSASDKGTSFLQKFKQFFKIITSSIIEAIKTNGDLVYIYRQKMMEQSIHNIEKTIKFKETLVSFSTLSKDKILEEVRDFARNYFQSQITNENRASLKQAFENYYHTNTKELDDETKELLLSLNIPDEKIQEFEHYLSNKYGAQYAKGSLFQKLVHDKLSLPSEGTDFASGCHAVRLDDFSGLYQVLNEEPKKSKKANRDSFFGVEPEKVLPSDSTSTPRPI